MSKSSRASSLEATLRQAVNGDRRAIAQLMSIAENDPHARYRILSALYARTGKGHIIGITGLPGSGKSTLISALAKHFRRSGASVGIVAVDPTSRVTGGALLGDRIRMSDLAADPKVFIRSMATRGQTGGIARATEDVVRIMDATSTEYIFIETVGAGQSDIDIKALAHTTVVVTAPGLGDEIQALKAGIMEIGDIFVINKSDKENADKAAQEIYSMLMMAEANQGWRARVLKTSALSGHGIDGLAEAIQQHSTYLKRSGRMEDSHSLKVRRDVLEAMKRYFEDVTLHQIASTREFAVGVSLIEAGKTDPYTVARDLVWRLKRKTAR